MTDITWGSDIDDSVLDQLQNIDDGILSVRISMFYYTRNLPSYVPFDATLGYVVGYIGPKTDSDTLNIAGDRVLSPASDENIPVGIDIPEEDLCYDQNLPEFPWIISSVMYMWMEG